MSCPICNIHSFLSYKGSCFITKNIENSSGKYKQFLKTLETGNCKSILFLENLYACAWLLVSYSTLTPFGRNPYFGILSSRRSAGKIPKTKIVNCIVLFIFLISPTTKAMKNKIVHIIIIMFINMNWTLQAINDSVHMRTSWFFISYKYIKHI